MQRTWSLMTRSSGHIPTNRGITHLLCLSSHEYQHVFRRVGTKITVGAVENQPSYQLDNPELLLERYCTFSKVCSTFWVSLCNCNEWLKL